MPHLLSVPEAAKRLSVSATYLNRLRCVGGGPTYAKLGGRVLYDPTDLDAWVEAQKRQNTSQYQTPKKLRPHPARARMRP